VKATPELVGRQKYILLDSEIMQKDLQLRQNLFETPFAHALLAFPGNKDTDPAAKPIGLALYFFNFSTWIGRPGLYVSLSPQNLRHTNYKPQVLHAARRPLRVPGIQKIGNWKGSIRGAGQGGQSKGNNQLLSLFASFAVHASCKKDMQHDKRKPIL
jgi:hypothetical protein